MQDLIEVTFSKVFGTDPVMLCSKSQLRAVVNARSAAILYRYGIATNAKKSGVHQELASRYNRTRPGIYKLIKRAENSLKWDKEYKRYYDYAVNMIENQQQPYTPELIRQGATVWTRADSTGMIFQGIVTSITRTHFLVGSFNDPEYHSANRLEDGRLSAKYETSRDVVAIKP